MALNDLTENLFSPRYVCFPGTLYTNPEQEVGASLFVPYCNEGDYGEASGTVTRTGRRRGSGRGQAGDSGGIAGLTSGKGWQFAQVTSEGVNLRPTGPSDLATMQGLDVIDNPQVSAIAAQGGSVTAPPAAFIPALTTKGTLCTSYPKSGSEAVASSSSGPLPSASVSAPTLYLYASRRPATMLLPIPWDHEADELNRHGQ
ncbi:hypothetical protein I317_05178 [Kwoniella heveanensis CBS 569]|nr:hypothetical protein I317_05178 [Kwoniella heveanensis CBS 569]